MNSATACLLIEVVERPPQITNLVIILSLLNIECLVFCIQLKVLVKISFSLTKYFHACAYQVANWVSQTWGHKACHFCYQ